MKKKCREIINPPKGWYPGEMYEGNNICLRCKKYNTEHNHETTTKKGFYKDGKYHEDGIVYNTCAGFPIWKERIKLECHNFDSLTK